MLYRYGLKLGLDLLVKGKLKPALRHLIIPVNYWRTLEYQLVMEEGNFQSGDKILDIGSPKLLSIFLAKTLGAKVVATDIEDYFIEKYSLLREVENISPTKYTLKVEDGRKLNFPDNSFNKIYSISVIEHIPDRGDSECAKEIGRVLAKGGRCTITVPFSPTYRDDYKDKDSIYWANSSAISEDGKVFYERRYGEEDLYNRIVEPSGLTLKKIKYMSENVMVGSERQLCDVLPPVTGPIQPVLSKLFHSTGESWQELKNPLCVLLVLEK